MSFGFYIHIPFTQPAPREALRYVKALRDEVDLLADLYAEKGPIDTLYFGGGTPSVLTLAQVQQVLERIYDRFELSEEAEQTFELQPADADPDYLSGLFSMGLNRLSVGVESFFEDDLRMLQTRHDAETAAAVIPMIREAGFENLSVDLCFGFEAQPVEYWGANLERVAGLEIPNVYVHEPDAEPTDTEQTLERREQALQLAIDVLTTRGYEHYEISHFARPGFRSNHTSKYWRHDEVIGAGAGAFGFVWQSGTTAQRWMNVAEPSRYAALLAQHRPPVDDRRVLQLDDLANEYILFRLRTGDGLDLDLLETRYGVDLLTDKVENLAWLEQEGLIHAIRNSRIRLTPKGLLVADNVTNRLLT